MSKQESSEYLLRRILAQRGVILDSAGRLRLNNTYTGSDRPTQEQLDVANANLSMHSGYSAVQLSWAQDLCDTIGRIIAGDSTDPGAIRAVFFLRLHGFIVDFGAHYRLCREALKGTAPAPTRDLAAFATVFGAIEQMQSALTEDEQLYAEYRRHVDAHIWQGPYQLQWNKKASVPKDLFVSKFNGKKYDIRDLNRRLEALVRRYGGEYAIAKDFAQRLAPHANSLLVAMTGWCSA